jgi:hypothetical protein
MSDTEARPGTGQAQSPGADAVAPPATPPTAAHRAAWAWLGILLAIAAAVVLCYGELWRRGASEVVPVVLVDDNEVASQARIADASYEAWLVARHARTLLRHPTRLFDTEHCYPEKRSLTFGIPMIAMGMEAIPASLVTRNPIAVYDATLALQSVVAALAMVLLMSRWTGRRAAGLVAGLLFAFHPIRLLNITYPTEWDLTWTVLALFFAERLFAGGRWRDALGLAAATSMQVATSFYPLLASALLMPPFAAWLLLRRGRPRLALPQLATAGLLVALAAALLLGPYLHARQSEGIHAREMFFYATWNYYAPSGSLFPGWLVLGLVGVGLGAPRRLALPRLIGDPRLPLLLGAGAVAFVAAGYDTSLRLRDLGLDLPVFDPYAALAAILPGLDAVRGVFRLSSAVHLVFCILAGAGSAALMQLAGRRAALVSAAAVAAAFVACFGAPLLGASRGYRWSYEAVHPSAESIAFFERLASMRDTGPLLELPIEGVQNVPSIVGVKRILLSGWHGRPTSACFGSFMPPARGALAALAAGLPGRESIRAMRELGFTTLVIHHPAGLAAARPLLRSFDAAANEPDPPLRLLDEIEEMSAYALVAEPPH